MSLLAIGADALDDYVWLLYEDAGDEQFNVFDPEHRHLACQYISELHRFGSAIGFLPELPIRDSEFYRLLAVEGLANLVESTSGSFLVDDPIVQRAYHLLHAVFSLWDSISNSVDSYEFTFAHHDIKKKNGRVLETNGERSFVLIDWELAGWGSPAVDLAQVLVPDCQNRLYRPSFIEYLEASFPYLSRLTVIELMDYARVGRILRLIASISWISSRFRFEFNHRSQNQLAAYCGELEQELLLFHKARHSSI